jgi:dTDP-4-amino-4,6-dideoxygalactose transaminase
MKEAGMKELAINGGPKTKETKYSGSNRFQNNEIEYTTKALESGNLFYGGGTWVHKACDMMKEYTGLPYVVPCTSGTASLHLAMIAARIGMGDEVICTPNTDTGSVAGVIAEGAVPVFCDVDYTAQPTAKTIADKITDRTRAVIVVHLAGSPAPMDEIMDLCNEKGLTVIEDCAQSWGTKLNGKQVGSFSGIGCFSTNSYKHISTGDGGLSRWTTKMPGVASTIIRISFTTD